MEICEAQDQLVIQRCVGIGNVLQCNVNEMQVDALLSQDQGGTHKTVEYNYSFSLRLLMERFYSFFL